MSRLLTLICRRRCRCERFCLNLQRSLRDNNPLYVAQHARGPAHVQSDYLSQPREVIATGTPIEVTRKILKEDRDAPALDEVFIRIAGRQSDEAVSN